MLHLLQDSVPAPQRGCKVGYGLALSFQSSGRPEVLESFSALSWLQDFASSVCSPGKHNAPLWQSDARPLELQWVRWPRSMSSSRGSRGCRQTGRFLGWGKTLGGLKYKGTRGQLFSTQADGKLDNHLDNKTQLPLIGFIFVTGENHAELKHAHCICRNWQAIS